jgi:hypothetical protein
MTNGFRAIYLRDVIRGVRDRFNGQYREYRDGYRFPAGKTVGEIKAALAGLNLDTCSRADVDEAMGTLTSWVSNACDECGAEHETLVRIGDEPDYDARWQDLCLSCLRKARDFLVNVEPKP